MSPNLKPKGLKSLLKPFLFKLFHHSDINSGKVRVSMGFYKKRVKYFVDFGKVQTAADYANVIFDIPKNVRGKKSNGAYALRKMRKIFSQSNGDRKDAQKIIVLMTDDKEGVNRENFLHESVIAKSAGVKIVTVGVGNADQDELRAAASSPINSVFVPLYSDLASHDYVDAVKNAMVVCMLE